MATLTLPRSSNPGQDGPDGATRIVNGYVESRGREGNVPHAIYASEGLKQFSDPPGDGYNRGMIVSGSSILYVSGRQLFKVDQGGTAFSLGGIAGDGPVSMAINQANPKQVMIVGAGQRVIVENDQIIPIEDPNLQPPNSVVSINQRFVATIANGRFQWSSLLNGLSWPALNFATAEYLPDGLVASVVRGSELLLFGPESIETWFGPDGAADESAFVSANRVIRRGALGAATVVTVEEVPFFVANDKRVRVIEGYATRPVSNYAVERDIQDADPALLEAFTYSMRGHSWYVLSSNGPVPWTWAYDVTEDSWIERDTYNLGRWCAQYSVDFNNRRILGHRTSNILFELDPHTYNENGMPMILEAWIPITAFPNRVKLSSLRLNVLSGKGTATLDPRVMVRFSRDNGKTFGHQRMVHMGKVGEYLKQVRLNRLGTSKEDGFVVSLSASADVMRAIVAADAETMVVRG